MSEAQAEIGVIGGSGFYSFIDGARPVQVDTPFGAPSSDPVIGEVEGRTVAFIARHGVDHRFPPHLVNYRANLWALRSLGVRQVLAPCAVGSLDASIEPGTVVIPDQVIDRTWGRQHTIYDQVGAVVHVPFADPYCPRGRAAVVDAARLGTLPVQAQGTLVVVNGPRFSSRAESRWHAASGGTVVGMTGMPEASIARELALCFTAIALVTDMDAGVEDGEGVTHDEVMAAFAQNMSALKEVIGDAVGQLPAADSDEDAGCACRHSLDGLRLPLELP